MQLIEVTKHYKTKNQYNKENTNTETARKHQNIWRQLTTPSKHLKAHSAPALVKVFTRTVLPRC